MYKGKRIWKYLSILAKTFSEDMITTGISLKDEPCFTNTNLET